MRPDERQGRAGVGLIDRPDRFVVRRRRPARGQPLTARSASHRSAVTSSFSTPQRTIRLTRPQWSLTVPRDQPFATIFSRSALSASGPNSRTGECPQCARSSRIVYLTLVTSEVGLPSGKR